MHKLLPTLTAALMFASHHAHHREHGLVGNSVFDVGPDSTLADRYDVPVSDVAAELTISPVASLSQRPHTCGTSSVSEQPEQRLTVGVKRFTPTAPAPMTRAILTISSTLLSPAVITQRLSTDLRGITATGVNDGVVPLDELTSPLPLLTSTTVLSDENSSPFPHVAFGVILGLFVASTIFYLAPSFITSLGTSSICILRVHTSNFGIPRAIFEATTFTIKAISSSTVLQTVLLDLSQLVIGGSLFLQNLLNSVVTAHFVLSYVASGLSHVLYYANALHRATSAPLLAAAQLDHQTQIELIEDRFNCAMSRMQQLIIGYETREAQSILQVATLRFDLDCARSGLAAERESSRSLSSERYNALRERDDALRELDGALQELEQVNCEVSELLKSKAADDKNNASLERELLKTRKHGDARESEIERLFAKVATAKAQIADLESTAETKDRLHLDMVAALDVQTRRAEDAEATIAQMLEDKKRADADYLESRSRETEALDQERQAFVERIEDQRKRRKAAEKKCRRDRKAANDKEFKLLSKIMSLRFSDFTDPKYAHADDQLADTSLPTSRSVASIDGFDPKDVFPFPRAPAINTHSPSDEATAQPCISTSFDSLEHLHLAAVQDDFLQDILPNLSVTHMSSPHSASNTKFIASATNPTTDNDIDCSVSPARGLALELMLPSDGAEDFTATSDNVTKVGELEATTVRVAPRMSALM